jgi:hypothetical protein
MHVRYADVYCPTCNAGPTHPCRTSSGYDYQFKYTHAAREQEWWRRNRFRAYLN